MAATCEYCIPALRENIRRNASRTTVNTDPRYDSDDFRLYGGACNLKRFNDGKELVVERLSGQVDVTCVGPENPTCPKNLGFILIPTREVMIDGSGKQRFVNTVVARKTG